jgi:hypothetical protein
MHLGKTYMYMEEREKMYESIIKRYQCDKLDGKVSKKCQQVRTCDEIKKLARSCVRCKPCINGPLSS